MTKCPQCKGTGYVTHALGVEKCSVCKGAGYIMQAATRDTPSEPTLPAWFDTFLTNVCELSDRNSPAEEQDAIVATLEELSNCALNAIEHCAASAPKEST